MTSADEVVDSVKRIVAERLFADTDSVDMDLLEDGGLDSVSLVSLVVDLETHFGVSLPFDELEIDNFRTIAKIAELVESCRCG